MKVKLVSDKKIAETSSKGNQEKWYEGGLWYKLDQFGYEALAETLISSLLERSNIEKDTPFTFVRYQMERIHVHGHDRTGCSSKNFRGDRQSIVTISHLHKKFLGVSIVDVLAKQTSDKKRIEYLAKSTAELTGLEYFPQYMTLLFEIDALFLNDDRHLNNIAVIEQDGKFDYCPIFDQGAGLLSNTQLLPMDIAPKALIASQRARPFNTTFNRQVGAARGLFGFQLDMPRLTIPEIEAELAPLLEFYPERDRGIITDRVCETIMARQQK